MKRVLNLLCLVAGACGTNIKFDVRRLEDGRTISVNGATDTVGPLIRLKNNEDLNLLIENRLEEPTAIHFHGMLLKNDVAIVNEVTEESLRKQWAVLGDGVPGLTQYEIKSQESYWQNVTVAEDTCGTFWYHSHYSVQYGEGLRGPIIVDCDRFDEHEKRVAEQYSMGEIAQEQVITLSEWYSTSHKDILSKLMSPTGGADPRVDGSLFNGKQDNNQVIKINPDTEYMRFRIISMSNGNTQVFHIANHKMVVIEIDGVLVQPVELETLSLATGQRYTVLIKRHEKNLDSDIVHASSKMMGSITKVHFLKYSGDDVTFHGNGQSYSRVRNLPGYEKHELYKVYEPIDWSLLPDPSDENKIALNYEGSWSEETKDKYGTGMYLVNNHVMQEYMTSNSGEPIIKDVASAQLSPVDVGFQKTVDISINSIDHMWHPWHLHGHHFQVISIGVSGDGSLNWDEPSSTAYQKYKRDLKYWKESGKTPMTRDSINIPGSSYVVIRFKSDSLGLWLLHCHVDWHMAKGLGVVLQEGLYQLPQGYTFSIKKPLPIGKEESPEPSKSITTSDGTETGDEPTQQNTYNKPASEEELPKISSNYPSKAKVLGIYVLIMAIINGIIYHFIVK